jgi:hypothetical protein
MAYVGIAAANLERVALEDLAERRVLDVEAPIGCTARK